MQNREYANTLNKQWYVLYVDLLGRCRYVYQMVNKFLAKEFGLRIKHLREQRKISQEKLSFITGFHRTYIGMIERGERNITLSDIAVFAKTFEMPIWELLNLSRVNPKHLYKKYQVKKEE